MNDKTADKPLDKPDSSLARLLAVLDLFDEQCSALTPEAIGEALQVSMPTAYRYVRLLADAGLLQRQGAATTGGVYALGPRIIVLDHLIRRHDPVLRHAVPLMQELATTTGLDCVATTLHGMPARPQLVDVHRVYSAQPASLGYGRGRPRPLLLGAAPKVVLASLPPAQLHKLLDQQADAVQAAGLPTDWPAQRRLFARIRQAGSYVSVGELEASLGAVAAPLVLADGRVLGAISLVTTVERLALLDPAKLAGLVRRAAAETVARIDGPG
jgi:DNA-binding IclR family transcriptional regulator